MKAIITRYLGPTNTKPARIKASAEGVKSKVWSCDELAHPTKSVHHEAATSFALRYGWPTKLASGGLPNGDWVHCFIQDSAFLRGRDLVVAQAKTFVAESYPTQPGLADGTRKCSAYHFGLLKNALEQLDA